LFEHIAVLERSVIKLAACLNKIFLVVKCIMLHWLFCCDWW